MKLRVENLEWNLINEQIRYVLKEISDLNRYRNNNNLDSFEIWQTNQTGSELQDKLQELQNLQKELEIKEDLK